LAGDQRSDADAEHQRQQQQAGFRRRRAADRAQIDRQERDQRHQRGAMAGRQRRWLRQTDGSLNKAGGISGEL
jgi:hypothetical protein